MKFRKSDIQEIVANKYKVNLDYASDTKDQIVGIARDGAKDLESQVGMKKDDAAGVMADLLNPTVDEVAGKEIHTDKWKRCFDDVKGKKGDDSAAAICTSSIGYDSSIKKNRQRKESEDATADRAIANDVQEPEVGSADYEKLTKALRSLAGQKKKDINPTPKPSSNAGGLPFEESVNKRRVLRTIKVKDL